MNETISSKEYVIDAVKVKDFWPKNLAKNDEIGFCSTKEGKAFFDEVDLIMKKNAMKTDNFIKKMREIKNEGKLRILNELDSQTMYDIFIGMNLSRDEISEFYDIHYKKVSKVFGDRGIHKDKRILSSTIRYGMNLIDVDKFCEFLTT